MSLELVGAEFLATRPPPVDMLAESFPEQRAFIRDDSRFKAAFCTRRAAKSYSVGLEHVDSAITRGAKHLIIGLTRDSVRDNFWDVVLKDINWKFQLGFHFNETLLEARAPSGGVIKLLGMDANDEEKRKALGAKRRKINIDEAQSFRTDLEPLVYGILKPSVTDHGGSISLTGTPGNMPRGLFYEVTEGKRAGWRVHKWDTFANTCIPTGETVRMCDRWREEIESLKRDNPRVLETPWFKQNYLGQWVIESDKLVYRYLASRNDYSERDASAAWSYVLGVDLGYNDPTAFVVCAYHEYDRTLYVLEATKEAGLDVTAVAQRIKALMTRYQFDKLIIDNANKQAVEELKRRHDLPLSPADKTGKSDFIELMNGDFIMGNIKLAAGKCDALAEEYVGLIWDEKKLQERKREEHPNCPNHCADAALYAWRYCYPYLSTIKPKIPTPGTSAWQQAQADEMREMMEREVREKIAEREEEEMWG